MPSARRLPVAALAVAALPLLRAHSVTFHRSHFLRGRADNVTGVPNDTTERKALLLAHGQDPSTTTPPSMPTPSPDTLLAKPKTAVEVAAQQVQQIKDDTNAEVNQLMEGLSKWEAEHRNEALNTLKQSLHSEHEAGKTAKEMSDQAQFEEGQTADARTEQINLARSIETELQAELKKIRDEQLATRKKLAADAEAQMDNAKIQMSDAVTKAQMDTEHRDFLARQRVETAEQLMVQKIKCARETGTARVAAANAAENTMKAIKGAADGERQRLRQASEAELQQMQDCWKDDLHSMSALPPAKRGDESLTTEAVMATAPRQ